MTGGVVQILSGAGCGVLTTPPGPRGLFMKVVGWEAQASAPAGTRIDAVFGASWE